jgi:hypothetical protein
MEFKNFTQKTPESKNDESVYVDFAQDALNEITAVRFNLMTTKTDEEALEVSSKLDLRHIEDYWSDTNQNVDFAKFDKQFPGFREDFNDLIDKIKSGITKSDFEPLYMTMDARTRIRKAA